MIYSFRHPVRQQRAKVIELFGVPYFHSDANLDMLRAEAIRDRRLANASIRQHAEAIRVRLPRESAASVMSNSTQGVYPRFSALDMLRRVQMTHNSIDAVDVEKLRTFVDRAVKQV